MERLKLAEESKIGNAVVVFSRTGFYQRIQSRRNRFGLHVIFSVILHVDD